MFLSPTTSTYSFFVVVPRPFIAAPVISLPRYGLFLILALLFFQKNSSAKLPHCLPQFFNERIKFFPSCNLLTDVLVISWFLLLSADWPLISVAIPAAFTPFLCLMIYLMEWCSRRMPKEAVAGCHKRTVLLMQSSPHCAFPPAKLTPLGKEVRSACPGQCLVNPPGKVLPCDVRARGFGE